MVILDVLIRRLVRVHFSWFGWNWGEFGWNVGESRVWGMLGLLVGMSTFVTRWVGKVCVY